MTNPTPTTARNATLQDLVPMLRAQQDVKLDAVVSATAMTSIGGVIHVKGMQVFGDAKVRPTAIMDGHIADRLDIPVRYVRRMRVERPDLYDMNFNGLVHGLTDYGWNIENPEAPDHRPVNIIHPANDHKFLLRTFTAPDGSEGIGRALLSDRFATYDNYDMLLALLEGVKSTGAQMDLDGCTFDLSERRMVVKLSFPEINVLAPDFLGTYRSPYSGLAGADLPVVSAGIYATNSETGGGAWTLGPRFTFKICNNGMLMTKEAFRAVHLGGKLDEGVVQWTEDTERKNAELVVAKTRDAISTFLDVDYMRKVIEGLTDKATKPLTDPVATVELVSKKLGYSEADQAGILDHFIKGASVTAGGVMQAVTSYCQTVEDPDAAFDLEASAVQALELAAA